MYSFPHLHPSYSVSPSLSLCLSSIEIRHSHNQSPFIHSKDMTGHLASSHSSHVFPLPTAQSLSLPLSTHTTCLYQHNSTGMEDGERERTVSDGVKKTGEVSPSLWLLLSGRVSSHQKTWPAGAELPLKTPSSITRSSPSPPKYGVK